MKLPIKFKKMELEVKANLIKPRSTTRVRIFMFDNEFEFIYRQSVSDNLSEHDFALFKTHNKQLIKLLANKPFH